MEMPVKDLVTLYFERTNASQTLWSFYITVIFGLLAFLSSATVKSPRSRIVFLLLVVYCCFAYINWGAIWSATNQRNILAMLIRSQAKDNNDPHLAQIADTLRPPTTTAVTIWHLLGDTLMIFGIVILGLWH